LASQNKGYGNLMLDVEQQTAFVSELPDVFLPIAGGWGRMGMTHIRLAAAAKDVVEGALRAAWKLRVEKNSKAGKRASSKSAKSAIGGSKPGSVSRVKTNRRKTKRR